VRQGLAQVEVAVTQNAISRVRLKGVIHVVDDGLAVRKAVLGLSSSIRRLPRQMFNRPLQSWSLSTAGNDLDQ
jgi:hypothetical protein